MIEHKREFANQQETTSKTSTAARNCDILLNIFKIKKKRFKILLNSEHVVWERFEGSKRDVSSDKNINPKEVEIESEQLSYKAAYGKTSNVLLIDDIIRIAKGAKKSDTFRLTPPSSPTVSSRLPQSSANNNSIDYPLPKDYYLTIHYAERVIKSEFDCNRWRVRTLTLYNSDAYIVRQWYTLLINRLNESKRFRVQRLLVFINPYGGRKLGLQTFERYCKPIFQLACIDASCIISQRANQIRDILMSHDLSLFDAVCCVGGDGTVAEVINGLIYRRMSDLGLDLQRPEYVPKPELAVGIIPAGSTDTVAYSVHGTSDVKTATLHLILGQKRGMDICSVTNAQGVIRFCASVLSYGYLGDVAANSEKYRWMGTKRYEFTGVRAFVLNKGYEAEIRLLDDEQSESSLQASSSTQEDDGQRESICYENCKKCVVASSSNLEVNELAEPNSSSNTSINITKREKDNNLEEKSLTNNDPNMTSNIKMLDSSEMNSSKCLGSPASSLNAVSKWKTIKGKFFMVTGANITCACTRSPNGIAKYSHLGDGNLDLILVRQTSMWNNIKFALSTMSRNGDIRNLPFVEVYRTRKFCLRTPYSSSEEEISVTGSCQPIADSNTTDNNDYVSSWNCDGEVVTDLNITMNSHCQLIDVFMRGPHLYNKIARQRSKCCC